MSEDFQYLLYHPKKLSLAKISYTYIMEINVTDAKKVYAKQSGYFDDDTSDTVALDNVSLSIESGEFYGLVGKNGAGKTTLIKCLTGQVEPDDGEVSVFGKTAGEHGPQIRRSMGILPERETPVDNFTPEEYFQYIGDIRKISEDDLDERVDEWVDKLSLGGKLSTLNKNLSRGQQQKVMIIGVFLHQPDIVFIDEPLANLDPVVQNTVKDHLLEYNQSGNTIMLSTHYTEAARELCTKIGVMDSGKLVKEIDVSDMDEGQKIHEMIENE